MGEEYLWLLDWHTNEYDVAEGFVVCATSPQAARKIAAEAAGPRWGDVWLRRQYTTCRRIGSPAKDVKTGVLLESYRAG